MKSTPKDTGTRCNGEVSRRPSAARVPSVDGERILSFGNRLADGDGSPGSMEEAFRDALAELLDGVDRVSVAVNVRCLLDADLPEPPAEFAEYIGREIERQMLEGFRRQGFPFEKYQEPVVTIYDNGMGDYLGVIILWREKGSSPIPESTLALLESLRPFMRFVFSALVSRHHYFRMRAN